MARLGATEKNKSVVDEKYIKSEHLVDLDSDLGMEVSSFIKETAKEILLKKNLHILASK